MLSEERHVMLLPRLAENNIEAALLDTRVVAVQDSCFHV